MDDLEPFNVLAQPTLRYNAKNAIRRVTVRQLLGAERVHTTAPFKIDGIEFNKVIIVASLSAFELRSGWTDYELEDGTGKIKARKWDSDDLEFHRAEFSLFANVRVTGDLEQYMGTKSIKAVDIQAVSSPYELYYHILHVITDTLAYERGSPLQIFSLHAAQGVQEQLDNIETKVDDSIPTPGVQTGIPPMPHPPPPSMHTVSTLSIAPLGSPPTSALDNTRFRPNHRPPSSTTFSTISKGEYKADTSFLNDTFDQEASQNESQHFINPPSSFSSITSPGHKPRRRSKQATDIQRPGYSEGREHRVTPTRSSRSEHTAGDQYGSPVADQPPSSPLVQSPLVSPRTSSYQRKYDPYSKLTSLQRDIILCIQTAAEEDPDRISIYPKRSRAAWKGVHISAIVGAVNSRRQGLTLEEFKESIEYLIEEAYIFNPVDDNHYSCTGM